MYLCLPDFFCASGAVSRSMPLAVPATDPCTLRSHVILFGHMHATCMCCVPYLVLLTSLGLHNMYCWESCWRSYMYSIQAWYMSKIKSLGFLLWMQHRAWYLSWFVAFRYLCQQQQSQQFSFWHWFVCREEILPTRMIDDGQWKYCSQTMPRNSHKSNKHYTCTRVHGGKDNYRSEDRAHVCGFWRGEGGGALC